MSIRKKPKTLDDALEIIDILHAQHSEISERFSGLSERLAKIETTSPAQIARVKLESIILESLSGGGPSDGLRSRLISMVRTEFIGAIRNSPEMRESIANLAKEFLRVQSLEPSQINGLNGMIVSMVNQSLESGRLTFRRSGG